MLGRIAPALLPTVGGSLQRLIVGLRIGLGSRVSLRRRVVGLLLGHLGRVPTHLRRVAITIRPIAWRSGRCGHLSGEEGE